MSTYAIGDLQGCYSELQDLLDKINFDETNDRLWFAGDLVNRGPESLKCLRFVKSLGENAKTVLGNHDLHILAIANNVRKPHRKDTVDEILNADDSKKLLKWLRKQPLLVNEPNLKYTMIHAGLPPQWTLEQAKDLAQETESLLQSKQFDDFIQNMYGDQPDTWSEKLKDNDRHRYIINALTRTRYCDQNGKLNIKETCAPGKQSESLIPWYALPDRKTKKDKLIFGHWSTVLLGNEKNFKQYNVYPLDTGCLWGGELTAMRLEDEKLFSVPSKQPKI
ncbi:MAG: symmetrical bis(5'-nucleosyl)-tetraphosphatase [Proteobacteria bacterium]|nr:symmetrical bis(5'-nucleosyl)-tetraphosphatase [Pseudomonadota bacterium]NOG59869.1 symmetrical bis(5'-nucleosyl)-tetraphosphatase [Pseudomonadota bacterium]